MTLGWLITRIFSKDLLIFIQRLERTQEGECSVWIHCLVLQRIKLSPHLQFTKLTAYWRTCIIVYSFFSYQRGLPPSRDYSIFHLEIFHFQKPVTWEGSCSHFRGKKTSMNSKDLVSLIVLYYAESKSLTTIYTQDFSTAQKENYTVSCSHIPVLLHCQELESTLELIRMKLAVFTSMCMEDGREVCSSGSGLVSRELYLHLSRYQN